MRLIYPATCGVCHVPLELEEEGICGHCQESLQTLRLSVDEAVLQGRFEALDQGWTLYHYESPVKEIIAAVKFSKKRWLVRVFQEEIKFLILALMTENYYDSLIPIPLDVGKLIEREFNQSELIGRLIKKWTGIPVKTEILRKRHKTPSQGLLSREERRVNLHKAFDVRHTREIEGKSILLVDDIYTTGSTAEEAARTLKSSGAKRVDLFALARTQLDSQKE